MTELKNLSARELADLLGLPLDKARAWLEVAASVPEESYHVRWLSDLTESSPHLRRSSVEELSDLTVEEALRMKRTGELYRQYPYLKPRAPKDADTRLRYLRELLRDEPDFGARFPAAYELLYGASSTDKGLLLPSFGVRVPVRVLESDPRESILPAGWHQRWKDSQDSGDAFSATFEKRMRGQKDVDQSFSPLKLGYMRGLLLAVLSREEYAERIATELHVDAIREKLGAPVQAPVRLTDLRLAASPRLGDPDSLKEVLKPQLRSLESPITPGGVLQWKWNLLWKGEDARGLEASEDENTQIASISFAAAALLLFLDLDMPEVERASPLRLATHVSKLAEIVRSLSRSLESNAKKLQNLLAYRDRNRPPAPGRKSYEALVAYRMGTAPRQVATELGMKPYKSSPSESGGDDYGGTREWKKRLEERLEQGARIEEQRYPLAASVFRHRDKPRIAQKALIAYRVYEHERDQRSEEESPWARTGEAIRVSPSTDWGFEVLHAYVQLGSCLERGLDPFPTRSDFGA